MKYCFLYIILNAAFSAPPLGGGKSVSDPFTYTDFIRIQSPSLGSCSATRVAPNKLLTAAHCVVDDQNSFKVAYSIGDPVLNHGTVKSIEIHPDYIKSFKAMDANKNEYKKELIKSIKMSSAELEKYPENRLEKLKSQFRRFQIKRLSSDIAFIILNENDSRMGVPYPQIISSSSKLGKRKQFKILGYGVTKETWNNKKKQYDTDGINSQGSIGENQWSCSPNNYENYTEKIDSIADDVFGVLNFNSTVTHSINGIEDEDVKYHRAMLLQGDSGAASIEKDESGELVVTALGSSTNWDTNDRTKAFIMVTDPSGKSLKIEVDGVSDLWKDSSFDNLELPKMKEVLLKNGLLINSKLKKGISVTRHYERNARASFADLLHPNNQSFIKSIMKASDD